MAVGATSHIKKNDQVQVMAGKENGKRGKVLRILTKRGRAVVEGLNMVKKAQRANPGKNIKGGILEKESPIHISNLLPICPECQKPVRIGHRVLDDGSSVRICRKCHASMEK
ncbi:MAG: 50S ribosomal protein L24 [Acidobacteria bacterium]|nr:50S ribosomal protein L24 [Acidobacteriota bacterium]